MLRLITKWEADTESGKTTLSFYEYEKEKEAKTPLTFDEYEKKRERENEERKRKRRESAEKRKAEKKRKEEMVWEKIVEADGRPSKEREDYSSDNKFEKNRKADEARLLTIDCRTEEIRVKVVLERCEWRRLGVERILAKQKIAEEGWKREKLEEDQWCKEIKQEEKR